MHIFLPLEDVYRFCMDNNQLYPFKRHIILYEIFVHVLIVNILICFKCL